MFFFLTSLERDEKEVNNSKNENENVTVFDSETNISQGSNQEL